MQKDEYHEVMRKKMICLQKRIHRLSRDLKFLKMTYSIVQENPYMRNDNKVVYADQLDLFVG